MGESSHEKEAEYIIPESLEISVGEIPYLNKLFEIFPALSSKNYLLYFLGQLISLIGTWLQFVAQGWLVIELTHSVFLLGLVSAVNGIPILLFSLYAGVIVDRFPKRKILLFTQTGSMILAFIFGILTLLHQINIWEILLLSFLFGLSNSLDSPARNAFAPELVGKERLTSAIALNSAIFNGARVIGPAVAGFLILLVGTGGAFIINGISYFAVIAALLVMKVPSIVQKHKIDLLLAIKEGLFYSFRHPVIRSLLVLISIVSIFGWSYTTVLPIISQDVFHKGATGLGYLLSAGGLGALTATILVSATSKKISSAIYIFGGNIIFAISIFLFSLNLSFALALVFLFFASFGLLVQSININSTIQKIVPNEIRGRVISIYVLMFIGAMPIGNFEIGWLSARLGTSFAIQFGALIIFVSGMFLFLRRKF